MVNDDKPDSDAPDAQGAAAAGQRSAWSEKGAEAELESLRSEVADLKDRLLRTMAEMENLRRRTERERTDTAKYAISAFARDVLSIADNIHRAIEAVPAEAVENDAPLKYLLDGVAVTERELLNVLERQGIKRLEPKGERFDPHLHQAMLEIENPEVPSGTVLDVLQAGYVIEDRVLRPALVAVSKGGEKPPATPKDAAPSPANNNQSDDGGDALAPEDPQGGGAGNVGARVDKSA